MLTQVWSAHFKKVWVCAVLLSVSGLVFPSSAPRESLLHIIRRLQKKYSRLHTISAEFEHVYHAPGSRTIRERGFLLLQKPRRMRWEYTVPEEKYFISDGKMVYFYVPADHQVTREKIKDADDLRVAFVFVLGRSDLRRFFHRIELTHSEAAVREGDYVLRLTPKKRYAVFAELILEVVPDSLKLVRVSILDLGGARSDFLLSQVEENVRIPPEEFQFTIPPNVHVLEVH